MRRRIIWKYERKLNLIFVFAMIIICNCKLFKMTECICAVCVCAQWVKFRSHTKILFKMHFNRNMFNGLILLWKQYFAIAAFEHRNYFTKVNKILKFLFHEFQRFFFWWKFQNSTVMRFKISHLMFHWNFERRNI